jgi:hypothetical protein
MSLFKEPFAPAIKKQLEARQDIIGRDLRTSQDIVYLNSKTAWIQLRSSVDIEFNGRISADGLATDNVLMGGALLSGNQQRRGIGQNGLGIYDTSVYNKSLNIIEPNILGLKPMPGITNISIQSKSAYGSLRQATVNFLCWDVKQLEILETLYMRPGYTVLLEWGWTPYIDSETNKLVSKINQDEDFFKHKNINIQKYLADLRGRALGSSGNYDAMFGYIKNYSWKYRPDGGYDCSTEIISTGEILESLKVNYSGASVSSNSSGTLLSSIQYSKIEDIQKEYRRNALAGLIAETYALIKETAGTSALGTLPVAAALASNPVGAAVVGTAAAAAAVGIINPDRFTSINEGSGTIPYTANNGKIGIIDFATKEIELEKDAAISAFGVNIVESSSDANEGKESTEGYVTDDDSNIYITLRSFVELLNNFILLENPDSTETDKNIIKLSVDDRPDSVHHAGQPLRCLYHPLQISVDPRVCIIKNPFFEKLIQGIKINESDQPIEIINTLPVKETTQQYKSIIKQLKDIRANDRVFGGKEQEFLNVLSKINTKEKLAGISDYYYTTYNQGFYDFLTEDPNKSSSLSRFDFLSATSVSSVFKGLGITQEDVLYFENDFVRNLAKKAEETFGVKTVKASDVIKAFINVTPADRQKRAILSAKNKTAEQQETLGEVKQDINNSTTGYLYFCNQLSQAYHTDDEKIKYGTHANIFINLRALYYLAGDPTLEGQDPAEKQTISLMSYMKDLLTMVQNSIGNVNNFEVVIDGNTGYIADVNYVPTDEIPAPFKFEIGNKRSVIRDISLESQIFSDQSTIIAVAAQSDAGKLGLENSSMVAYNTGIKDRNIFRKDTPLNNNRSNEDQISGFILALSDLSELFDSMTKTLDVFDSELLVDSINKYKKSLTNIIAFFTAYYKSDNKYKAILPTKLSLTTDGIGGLIIGNIFDIDKTFTPRAYKGEEGVGIKLQYLVTNIKQDVGANNQWTTTIEGNPYIPDESFDTLTKDQKSIEIGMTITKKYVYDQSTGKIIESIANNTPIGDAPVGIPGSARAMASAMNYTFPNGAPGPGGRCARYTYNIAQKYTVFRKNPKANVTRGAQLSSGGNANEENWRKTLEKLGYNTTLVAKSFTREQLKNYMNTSTWNVGDVVSYFSHNLNHFHAQIFTGGMSWDSSIKSFNLNPKVNKWSSDFPQNYGSAFVYYSKIDSNSYHLYVHKLLS